MRDIAISLIVVIGCVWALRRPHVGILLWVWISVMNPHRLAWGFAYSMPFAQMAALATFAGLIANRNSIRFPVAAPNVVLMVFLGWMGLTTMAAIFPQESAMWYLNTFKVMLMTLVAFALIHTKQHINQLMWVIVISLGYYGVKGGLFIMRSGGENRVWGPPTSFIESNNELAVALLMTIPLMYYLGTQVSKKWIKYSLYGSMALCAIGALGTHSRGALLAIGAMAIPFWWRSHNKAVIGMALLLVVPVMLAIMPANWFERMQTISSYSEDRSAMGRLNAWEAAINIANDRPLGAGFANDNDYIFSRYAPPGSKALVAHSIYFQVLGAHGYIGLFLFLLLWWTTLRMAVRADKLSAGNPDLLWISHLMRMMRVSFIGYLVGGAFLNLAYFDVPFYMMVIVVAAHRLAKEAQSGAGNVASSATLPSAMSDRNAVGSPVS